MNDKTTHFGYRKVRPQEKTQLVEKVFHSVFEKYDLMNDLMSFGLHRLWKCMAINAANIRPGQTILDLAAGTGDLSKACAKQVGKTGKVVMTDINASMLQKGRARLEDEGYVGNICYVQANAEDLPFADNYFDRILIGFGLRNVTDKAKALQSMYRVLKPGGKLVVLEFSHPKYRWLDKLYHHYSFKVIPKIGEVITHDRKSYQYLVESIRMHPDQETLKSMMMVSGFEDVAYQNLNGGIVALHTGHKY